MAKAPGKKRGPPQKECPTCHKMVHARKAICPECGAAIPKKQASPKVINASESKTRPTAQATVSNGRTDVRAILTVHALLKTMDANQLKRIVDDVANTQIPF